MSAAPMLTPVLLYAAVAVAPGRRERCGAETSHHGGACIACCEQQAAGVTVPVRPGQERPCIVRTMERRRPHVESCRRYNRNPDAFIDVPVRPDAGRES